MDNTTQNSIVYSYSWTISILVIVTQFSVMLSNLYIVYSVVKTVFKNI